VADRIGSLISPRALLPVAKAVSTSSVFRLLNADGKTVARVVVDRTATAGTELNLRVRVAEVRGYPAQARRAAALLAAIASPASEPVFAAAAIANGRPAGGYSGKVDAAITARMPAQLAVAILLTSLLDTLEQNVDGVLRDIDTEFLHDLRVAVRRTRSALKLLGDVLPADLTAHYKTEFKWLGDLTTPVRDLDVYLLGFGDLTDGLLAATPEDLEPFREFLVRQRAGEFRRLAAERLAQGADRADRTGHAAPAAHQDVSILGRCAGNPANRSRRQPADQAGRRDYRAVARRIAARPA
jgi:hypothetical protein